LAVALGLASVIPQIPAGDALARARALSELGVRYRRLAPVAESLGLFTITGSWVLRAALALAACCVLLRMVESAWRVATRGGGAAQASQIATGRLAGASRSRDAIALTAYGGAVLLITGLLITQVWGWEATGIALQGQGRVPLPGEDAWMAYGDDGRVSVSAGLQTRDIEHGPGAVVEAVGADGALLWLKRGHDAPATRVLQLALTTDPDLETRDVLFAIPEVNLVARVAPLTDAAGSATGELVVQAYRSSSGELVGERAVRGRSSLSVGEVMIEVKVIPYARTTAHYSPGRWSAVAGVIALLIGVVSAIGSEIVLAIRDSDDRDRPAAFEDEARQAESRGT
jgi:hypothetical protein